MSEPDTRQDGGTDRDLSDHGTMEGDARIINTPLEALGPEGFASTSDVVMTGLRRSQNWKSAVYNSGSAIVAIDNGTLVPDIDRFVEEYVESAKRLEYAISAMASTALNEAATSDHIEI